MCRKTIVVGEKTRVKGYVLCFKKIRRANMGVNTRKTGRMYLGTQISNED
jgi:hypothetical protein